MASPQTVGVPTDPAPFQVKVDVVNRTLAVSGELDLATGTLLLDSADLVAASGGDITVDLAAVTFMDSIALSTLVTVAARQAANGHQLFVINPSARHRRLFMITGLARMLRTKSS